MAQMIRKDRGSIPTNHQGALELPKYKIKETRFLEKIILTIVNTGSNTLFWNSLRSRTISQKFLLSSRILFHHKFYTYYAKL